MSLSVQTVSSLTQKAQQHLPQNPPLILKIEKLAASVFKKIQQFFIQFFTSLDQRLNPSKIVSLPVTKEPLAHVQEGLGNPVVPKEYHILGKLPAGNSAKIPVIRMDKVDPVKNLGLVEKKAVLKSNSEKCPATRESHANESVTPENPIEPVKTLQERYELWQICAKTIVIPEADVAEHIMNFGSIEEKKALKLALKFWDFDHDEKAKVGIYKKNYLTYSDDLKTRIYKFGVFEGIKLSASIGYKQFKDKALDQKGVIKEQLNSQVSKAIAASKSSAAAVKAKLESVNLAPGEKAAQLKEYMKVGLNKFRFTIASSK